MDGSTVSDDASQVQRLVVMLRYHDELSWPEIAAVLELTEENVRGAHDAVIARMRWPRRATK